MLSRHFAGPLTLVLSLFLFFGQANLAAGAEAKAPDGPDPIEKVQRLNLYAMQLFDDLNFALAEKSLLEAVSVLEKANLATAPVSLATHGNLAVLYSVGLKKPDKAVAEFKKALAIKPDLKMSKRRATADTEANLARARAEMGMAPAEVKPAEPPREIAVPEPKQGEPAAAGGLRCPGGGEIQAGDDVNLKCVTSDPQIVEVVLSFKANGADDYQVVPMTRGETSGTSTTWAATIPGADTNAKWVPMFFEAHNRQGAAIAYSGRADSPNVITVKGSESGGQPAAKGEGDEGDEEEGEEIDDNNPLARLEAERRRESEGMKGTWMFALGVGSGIGYAVGKNTETFHGPFNSGFAPAYLGHAVPEIGYFIGRNTALSVAGRLQWMPGMRVDGMTGNPATGAMSVLVRALFFTEAGFVSSGNETDIPEKSERSRIRWYFALAAGGGEGFRLRVQAGVKDQQGNPLNVTVPDEVRGGPFVAGLGGGMVYKITRRWHWTLDTQVLVGIPNYSSVLDLTTGVRWMH